MVEPIAPTLRANLITLATAYVEITGVSWGTISRHTTNDKDTLARLRDDPASSITIRKYDDALKWFTENWPAGQARPSIVNPSHRDIRPRARRPAKAADRRKSA